MMGSTCTSLFFERGKVRFLLVFDHIQLRVRDFVPGQMCYNYREVSLFRGFQHEDHK